MDKQEEVVMRMLHYFITEQDYNPIVLHGAKDEIWLENLDNHYPIVRISSNYIHNNEQLDFDLFKTKAFAAAIALHFAISIVFWVSKFFIGAWRKLFLNFKSKGDSFGEFALINNAPRITTVKTVSECELWVMKREVFRKIIDFIFQLNYNENKKFLDSINLPLEDSFKKEITFLGPSVK